MPPAGSEISKPARAVCGKCFSIYLIVGGVVWGIGDNESVYACDVLTQSWNKIPPFSPRRSVSLLLFFECFCMFFVCFLLFFVL